MVMRVLPPSTAAFRAGSRVSGLGPSWTVKPVPSPVAASAASVVAVSALPLVSVVLAEEPQASQRNCHAGSHRRGDDSLVLHVACILLMDLSYTRCLSVTGEH